MTVHHQESFNSLRVKAFAARGAFVAVVAAAVVLIVSPLLPSITRSEHSTGAEVPQGAPVTPTLCQSAAKGHDAIAQYQSNFFAQFAIAANRKRLNSLDPAEHEQIRLQRNELRNNLHQWTSWLRQAANQSYGQQEVVDAIFAYANAVDENMRQIDAASESDPRTSASTAAATALNNSEATMKAAANRITTLCPL